METSQPLSIESFSYSWLVNLTPSLESLDSASLDACDEASFIEMDPRMPPSKRFFRNSQADLKFDFPISQSPVTLVHADELFSNGYVMPLFVDPLKVEAYNSSTSTSTKTLPTSSHPVPSGESNPSSSFTRCPRMSKRLFSKYLDFFRPLYRRIRGHKSRSRARGSGSRVGTSKDWFYSADQTSPRISSAYSADDWRKSCDSESSIYEAVLHCKRSIEQQ